MKGFIYINGTLFYFLTKSSSRKNHMSFLFDKKFLSDIKSHLENKDNFVKFVFENNKRTPTATRTLEEIVLVEVETKDYTLFEDVRNMSHFFELKISGEFVKKDKREFKINLILE
jgi:hypothetical protein